MTQDDEQAGKSRDARARILAAAAALLEKGGSEAATTRAVAEAASVQAPTIYRLFGDKQGLLDALAEATYADYLARKLSRPRPNDAVEALSQGWDDYIAFALANPAIFNLQRAIYPAPAAKTTLAGRAALARKVALVAQAGRLVVTEEMAVELLYSTAFGCVLSLLAKPPDERPGLSEAARDMVFERILSDASRPAGGRELSGIATTLRSRLDEATVLSAGERLLMDELLFRISSNPVSTASP